LNPETRFLHLNTKPPFSWIFSNEEGRIFVSTWTRIPQSNGYYYDVFDIKGKYLIKIPIEGGQLVFKNGKLYVIYKDKEGFQYIKRFKVMWKI
jgi:hypothetical protein